jgi:hypothetical protein
MDQEVIVQYDDKAKRINDRPSIGSNQLLQQKKRTLDWAVIVG